MTLLGAIFQPLPPETVLQLGLAILLGGAIGLERQVRGRAAGLRTMIIVCLGSTLIMVVSARLSEPFPGTPAQSIVRVDPGRIAAGIVTGVGFLGAGVVLKLRDLVRGVTTAACIWFVAGLGIAIGEKHYTLAMAATVSCLFVLWGIQRLDRLLPSPVYRTVILQGRATESEAVFQRASEILRSEGIRLMDVQADTNRATGSVRLTLRIRAIQGFQAPATVAKLAGIEGVVSVNWH